MPFYRYKALTQKGNYIMNTYQANNKNEVIHMLQAMNYYPISIQKAFSLQIFFKKMNSKELSIFCRQFYVLFHAGVDIIRCFHALTLQTTNKNLKIILKSIEESLKKGQTLTLALTYTKVFPQLFINMIQAGEMSGKLDKILKKMAIHYEKESKFQKKIATAMIYPLILCITSILVVIFLLTYVIPCFINMFENAGVQLPLPTRILLIISSLCIHYWYFGFILLIFSACWLYRISKKDNTQMFLDKLKFRIPIMKRITQIIISIRFSRTLALLLSSGISLISALEITSKAVSNKFVENQIKKSIEEIAKGESLAKSVKEIGLFSPLMISMIEIGEEAGTLDNLLDQTADFMEEEIEKILEKILPMLEPLLITVMAIIIGFILLAMVMPIFEITNTIY
ncbi:type II secretion system F family protein [Crassaminicella indica]|uniref:Type II secretion system F family protein n=1 Tax=Crassaminicella indica TaxID=2855394 RepID=A0ABX8RAF9_9CLOT|nr:type II secretion system F family protein [Crassaminicella indica]QXM06003.1 type II secretion system F family protein [Crassaminicella indica]